MKLHNLKIKAIYAEAKLKEDKMFEIRKNDRNFEIGDVVNYTVIDDTKLDKKMVDKRYIITYITDYEQKDGYVVFGEREVKEQQNEQTN